MKLIFKSLSINEGFARVAVSAFAAQKDMTIEELNDIKTAVSEAVTNSIVHGYKNSIGDIYITCGIYNNNTIRIKIRDKGCGIEDIEKAMEPMYSSLGGDRAGLGFSVMECFTDRLKVSSKPGKGTTVILEKKVSIKC
ncbi:MAG: anti-sigma F factor [Clostridiales bacterium]|jgi:stage II sporulation protein AB (anti-sigma F factor)|nr:anti-sigma F factor [Clostridiales bacterium]